MYKKGFSNVKKISKEYTEKGKIFFSGHVYCQVKSRIMLNQVEDPFTHLTYSNKTCRETNIPRQHTFRQQFQNRIHFLPSNLKHYNNHSREAKFNCFSIFCLIKSDHIENYFCNIVMLFETHRKQRS